MKLLVPTEPSGCHYWRTFTPTWALQRKMLAEIRYFDARSFTSKEVSDGLKWCDAIVFRGAANEEGYKLMMQYQSLGKQVFVDQDDYNFEVDPLNPAYKRFGTEEVEIETEHGREWLWKDGVDGFDLQANIKKAGFGLAILRDASIVTTTTPYLKKKFQDISGREEGIFVVPNAVDKRIWKPVPDARDKYTDGFRFGWMISDSHQSDLLYIRETFRKFLLNHKDAKLVILGDTGVDLAGYFPEGQVEWIPFVDLYAQHYPTIAGCLGLDVAVAPLAHTDFNRCKSPLKFAEYTYLGYPTILEDIETYNPYVVSGESAMLAGTPEQWTMCLERLYSDKTLRHVLHFNALQVCDALFDIDKVAYDWYNTYKFALDKQGVILK